MWLKVVIGRIFCGPFWLVLLLCPALSCAQSGSFQPYYQFELPRDYKVSVVTDSVSSMITKRVESAESELLYRLPERLSRERLKTGLSWQSQVRTTLLKQNLDISVKFTVAAVGESVTAGTREFSHCIEILARGQREEKLGMLGLAIIEVQGRYWFAPGVGLIKATEKQISTNPLFAGGERRLEIVTR